MLFNSVPSLCEIWSFKSRFPIKVHEAGPEFGRRSVPALCRPGLEAVASQWGPARFRCLVPFGLAPLYGQIWARCREPGPAIPAAIQYGYQSGYD